MKKDIKQVDYMDVLKKGSWWVWNAYCDECKKQFRDYGIYSSEKPDLNKKDLCLDCLRKIIDNYDSNGKWIIKD